MADEQRALTKRIQRGLAAAESKPGKRCSQALQNGLNVYVTVQDDGQVLLEICRALVWPSAMEWQVVLDHWPYKVPPVRPGQKMSTSGQHCLHGLLPARQSAWQEADSQQLQLW